MMLTAINPQAASNFLDEDHMKVMRSVGKACHPATAKTKWANRYIVKKAITWMRMQNKKQVRQNKCVLMLSCPLRICKDTHTYIYIYTQLHIIYIYLYIYIYYIYIFQYINIYVFKENNPETSKDIYI